MPHLLRHSFRKGCSVLPVGGWISNPIPTSESKCFLYDHWVQMITVRVNLANEIPNWKAFKRQYQSDLLWDKRKKRVNLLTFKRHIQILANKHFKLLNRRIWNRFSYGRKDAHTKTWILEEPGIGLGTLWLKLKGRNLIAAWTIFYGTIKVCFLVRLQDSDFDINFLSV